MVTFVTIMELTDRIRYLMKVHQLTASAFAHEIGVQPSSVSHLLSGRNKPSLDFIQKVLKRFPKTDAGWLITGDRKVAEKSESGALEPKSSVTETQKVANPEKEVVNVTSVKSSSSIDRIVIFYKNGTFDLYHPS